MGSLYKYYILKFFENKRRQSILILRKLMLIKQYVLIWILPFLLLKHNQCEKICMQSINYQFN
jgi:hypothetical protein